MTGRDLRIDLIRGLALWMIFLDHTAGNPLNRITYGHVALPDALDIFVFLSGLSCGILYGKLILAHGFVAAQTRALRRAGQLYVAQVLIGFVNIACYFAFRPLLDSDYLATYDVALLAQEPLRAVGAMLGLVYTPQMMDILPLYLILVLATPAFVLLLTRSQAVALALSASLWLAAAAIPGFTIPSLGLAGEASYDPFSWQLLFCIGLWLGKRHYVDGVPFRPRRSLLAVCWMIVAIGFAARHAGMLFGDPDAYAWAVEPSVVRSHIHPARLINFLAWVYLVAAYLRADSGLVRSRWTESLRLCGRHSLEVFCAAAPVSIVATIAVLKYGPTFTLEAIATVTGVAAMIAVARFMDHRRMRRRHARDVAPERRLQRAGART
ncbi:MAG TPA: OpgC domain-containing protein [Alphaproteobacteria bacterium]|nr:OpgC domain-containing protein [Alphaproteobacteria bacterium]